MFAAPERSACPTTSRIPAIPLSGVKHGVAEVAAFFTEFGKAGFQADPIFLRSDEEHVVDVHRGWTTRGVGKVDTLWALV
ncbi:hypothetical protein [Nonomuraea sp. NPDC049400]|uniref:hypothetical protein n=1 Tax=Nonomuraea sp. NPDC049400 TaxID=3364352 RepID=UPI003791DEEF